VLIAVSKAWGGGFDRYSHVVEMRGIRWGVVLRKRMLGDFELGKEAKSVKILGGGPSCRWKQKEFIRKTSRKAPKPEGRELTMFLQYWVEGGDI